LRPFPKTPEDRWEETLTLIPIEKTRQIAQSLLDAGFVEKWPAWFGRRSNLEEAKRVWKTAHEVQMSDAPGRLFWFCQNIMGFKKLLKRVHGDLLCNKLESCLRTNARHFIEWHRSSFKTTVVSLSFPLWVMGTDPLMEVLLIQATKDQVKKTLETIILSIENNLLLRAIFPGLEKAMYQGTKKHVKWDKSDGILVRATLEARADTGMLTRGYSLSTGAVDKRTAGEHPTVLLVDDVENEINTESDTMIEKVKSRMRQILGPVLQRDCPAIMVGTPWKYGDYHHDVRNSDRWDHSVLPLRNRERGEDGKYTYAIPREEVLAQLDLDEQYGTCGFDERTEEEFVQDMDFNQYDIEAQLFCNPVPQEEQKFPADGWQTYCGLNLDEPNAPWHFNGLPLGQNRAEILDLEDAKADWLDRCGIYVAVDVAHSEKTVADYTCIGLWAIDSVGNAWLLDLIYDKINPSRTLDAIFDLFDPPRFDDGKFKPKSPYWMPRPVLLKEREESSEARVAMLQCWRPLEIQMQDVTYEKMLYHDIKEEQKRRGIHFRVCKRTHIPSTDKHERIRNNLHTLFVRRRFRFPLRLQKHSYIKNKGIDAIKEASKEYHYFGQHRYDDFMDMVMVFHPVMRKPHWDGQHRSTGRVEKIPEGDVFDPVRTLGLQIQNTRKTEFDAPHFEPSRLIRKHIDRSGLGVAVPSSSPYGV
jgi:hypothetical protein